MLPREIHSLWEEFNACIDRGEHDEGKKILEKIMAFASNQGLSEQEAQAKIHLSWMLARRLPSADMEATIETVHSYATSGLRVLDDSKDRDSGGTAYFRGEAHEALAIIYLFKGDQIRAYEHQAKWDKIYKDSELEYKGLNAAMLFQTARDNAVQNRFDVPDGKFVDWLLHATEIKLSNLPTRVGEYVTNDRFFYYQVLETLQILKNKLKPGLKKPENFILEFISIKLQMLVKPSESGITAKCCEPLCLLA